MRRKVDRDARPRPSPAGVDSKLGVMGGLFGHLLQECRPSPVVVWDERLLEGRDVCRADHPCHRATVTGHSVQHLDLAALGAGGV